MERTLMQVYVKGSDKAVEMYIKAFNASLGSHVKNDDGTYYHSEVNVYGQILSVAECSDDTVVTGNAMQFCLHFKPEEKSLIDQAYEVLKQDATILHPLGETNYSPYMTDLIDKYGVRWCLFY
ncbi:VOC family protein [Breznakia pachnodae]|uniref:PhnB protein n=1 Tax=Breznakia pachnodae TaxID=265178 RepID=A0ABU0E4Z5_9FIRM|nr:VOC family protein [Breznakia pachnodae]MDQ0361981.1 PhnB protein [Breznakia pachnodae]